MRATGMAVAQLVLAVVATVSAPDLHSRGVNLYVGDLSAVFGYVPALDGLAPSEAERARVRGHLLFVHDLLVAVDTSGWPAARRAARARNLDRLRAYALAGEFPHNDAHADRLRPTFVDDAGTLCAVGALLAADRGRAAAERIAATQKYAFVAQIEDGELASWQQTSGLSVAELGLIQPTYSEPPETSKTRVWVPFGLLDRVQITAPRLSATAEMTARDGYDTTSLTLHAQASTSCDCNIGVYGTLPMSIAVGDEPIGTAAAGSPVGMDGGRTTLGTADIGVFGGTERWTGVQKLYRLGVLLPTATRDQRPLLASARVGDAVLELPRTAGVRISTSMLAPIPSEWIGSGTWSGLRGDLGLDVAVEYANDVHDRIVHVMPRAGVGAQLARSWATLSLDTALALDPLVDFEPRLRWGTGLTARLVRRDGNRWFIQPAFTVAAVRTPDGWSGTLALDIAASGRPKPRY